MDNMQLLQFGSSINVLYQTKALSYLDKSSLFFFFFSKDLL